VLSYQIAAICSVFSDLQSLQRMAPQGQSAHPLDNLQAEFSILLGASFSHPDHTTAYGTERFWI
jgi:hypothetical protein